MRAKEFLRENAVELYHGTLRTNVQSILANGLNPTVGEFTKSIYASKAKPLVFAADIKGSRAVYCALQSQIGMKLGKFPPTAEEIAQHGALLVISRDVNKFKQYNAKRRQGSKEPTDYTSQQTVHIDNVITGKDLLRWIKTHNADWGEMSCPTDVQQDIAEAPLPPDWDPEKIDLQQTFRDRIQYVVDRARRIGGGSARVAFDIDYQGRPTVIKVAKNRKGLIQNKAEIDVYLKNKGRWGANRLVVPLVDYDQENSPPVWIQTERARRIQAPTLLRLLHAPDWWTFLKLVAHYRGLIKPNQMMFFKTPEDIEDDYIAKGGSEQEWEIFSGYARDLANLVKATTLEDYGHVGNWGEYQGRPVLLDLGFTDESKTAYGFKE